MATAHEHLLFDVSGNRCALSLVCIDEIMRPQPLSEAKNAPVFVSGLSVIRGRPTVVLDASRLLLRAGAADGDVAFDSVPSRLILLRVGERRVALSVSGVDGVQTLNFDVTSLPPLLQHDAVTESLASLDGRLLRVLSAVKLLGSLPGDVVKGEGLCDG